jgi:hypothetical protein
MMGDRIVAQKPLFYEFSLERQVAPRSSWTRSIMRVADDQHDQPLGVD